MSISARHRPAAVAGQFYAEDPSVLRAQLATWLDKPEGRLEGRCPKVLVVPHAGYVYSGALAAKAYELLRPFRRCIRRVVLLGPAHRVALRGLALPSVVTFDTPLGATPLDLAAYADLEGLSQVGISDEAHAKEHSLEVQLPFLQQALDTFTLIPLVVGHASPDEVAQVLERLWGGDETLIVISTDLSHFLTDEQARQRDGDTVQRILAMDTTLDPYDACGAMPLNGALLAAADHGLKPELLGTFNSGAMTGDYSRVVGYAALALWADAAGGNHAESA